MAIFGFIGVGNMGGALLGAVTERVNCDNILVSDTNIKRVAEFRAKYGISEADNEEICKTADFIYLGLKPQILPAVSESLSPILKSRNKNVTIVSMAAGVSIERIKSMLGDIPVIRIMPNLPVLVGEGTVLYTHGNDVCAKNVKTFSDAMDKCGKLTFLDEKLIDAGSAISGCGPAFAALFAEALADGGVYCGLSRKVAQELALQTLKGTAALMQANEESPAELKDKVCSPGGTTIEGVKQLEDRDFRSAVINAVIAAYEKNFKL